MWSVAAISLVSTPWSTSWVTSRSRAVSSNAATTSGTISGGRASSMVTTTSPPRSPDPDSGEACSISQTPWAVRTRACGIPSDSPRASRRAALFRGSDDQPFGEAEVAFLGTLSEAFGRGVRSGLLARMAEVSPPGPVGPAVMVVNADDELVQSTPGAAARLAEMSSAAPTGTG